MQSGKGSSGKSASGGTCRLAAYELTNLPLRTFTAMNWLDWTIIALAAYAAIKGFSRGFIVELASLVAMVAGVWVAARFADQVTEAIGLGSSNAAIAFLVTFLLVVVAVHFLARFLTTLIDIAQLGLPNKLAGVLFGMVRALFMLSIALNLLMGYSDGEMPAQEAREGSTLYTPVAAFAPLLIPALGETKWVKNAADRVREEAENLFNKEAH